MLSTLRYFRDEYIAHIVDKKCPAGVCKDLLQYKIDPDKCKGCTLCARTCPADAIIGKVKEVHMINPEKCEFKDQWFKCDSACRLYDP